jgi:hypothetical protein
LPSPLKRPQLSRGTQAFSHSAGQERAGTEGEGSSVLGIGNGAGVAIASGSGTVTVVNTGLGALRGWDAVWQPAANNARRLARVNRRKNNTRRILLTNEDDTSPLSQQPGFRIDIRLERSCPPSRPAAIFRAP